MWAAAGIDTRIAELDRELLAAEDLQRTDKLAAAYDDWKRLNIIGGNCTRLRDTVAHEAFRAAARVARYRGDPASLHDMQCPYKVLESRAIADPGEHLDMYLAFVQNRRFNEANALAEKETLSVPHLPRIMGLNAEEQGVLQTSSDGSVAWKKWMFRDGEEIVAYVSPLCANSRRAMAAIAEDPAWAWVKPKIRFVVRRAPTWPYPGVDEWNRLHPDMPMQNQAAAAGWSDLDVHETPVFQIVRDGVKIQTVYGWANSGAELAELKDQIDPSGAGALSPQAVKDKQRSGK